MHRLLLALTVPLLSCNGPTPAEDPFADLAVDEARVLPGLRCDAQIVRTAGGVPYIYAYDRADLARALGYAMGQDRFFEMDLARRLGLGVVSEFLGQDALETDMESRSNGMTAVADNILAVLTPEQAEIFDAFAEGVNAYIVAVRQGDEPLPSELVIAGPLLGASEPSDLMTPWDRRSVAGVGATLIYELGFETGDVRNTRTVETLQAMLDAAEEPLAVLRAEGAIDDLWGRIAPIFPVPSAPGWGSGASGPPAPNAAATPRPLPRPAHANGDMLARLDARLDRLQGRLGHDWEDGFGSNAWAVMGSHTPDGKAILAGDGHLPLSVPSLFWTVGVDTSVLGGGDTHQVGMFIPGLPFMGVGSNGDVAWGQTQLMGDITDWYREELTLDGEGYPASTLFQGAQQPLVSHEETFVIADIPLLGSEGRTETWTRYTTFDGRWIADVEGRSVRDPDDAEDGEAVIMLGGDFIIPEDVDGDGIITAVSFDYTGLDAHNVLLAIDRFGHAEDVEDFKAASQGLVAYSQNMVVADRSGSVLYTGYQAVPCRSYLPRDAEGWAEGAHPAALLDGTTYGGFTIPISADGKVDESQSSDPYSCVVPLEEYPHAIDPAQGYVLSANTDPGGLSFDQSLTNDGHYIGGPWMAGYRADSIDQLLSQATAEGWADVAGNARIQADTRSRQGEQLAPVAIEAYHLALYLSSLDFVEPGSADERILNLYLAHQEALDEAAARLEAWVAADTPTPSGVETFYSQPADGDLDHAVATMIFNAWWPRFFSGVFNDEGLPDVWEPTGNTGNMRGLDTVLQGRGPGNPLGLSSWNPDTEESVFFDVLGTEELETSDEVALSALVDALAWLETEDGFGTADQSQWIWGYKHTVHFDSILGDFLGTDGAYGALTEQFSITTDTLPLMPDLDRDDPRYALTEFPRPGDQNSVDAANPGGSGTRFSYGSGPVFRTVIALGPDGAEGINVIPGGSSGLVDSEHFADQAALWLGNETLPLHFELDAVLGDA
ncbi:MAG: penicillin acylase family protein, partial [Alphaproteobacteria bacterium]|nr:penicillin acylase family protein [Alphaproteobacteria bacterium]